MDQGRHLLEGQCTLFVAIWHFVELHSSYTKLSLLGWLVGFNILCHIYAMLTYTSGAWPFLVQQHWKVTFKPQNMTPDMTPDVTPWCGESHWKPQAANAMFWFSPEQEINFSTLYDNAILMAHSNWSSRNNILLSKSRNQILWYVSPMYNLLTIGRVAVRYSIVTSHNSKMTYMTSLSKSVVMTEGNNGLQRIDDISTSILRYLVTKENWGWTVTHEWFDCFVKHHHGHVSGMPMPMYSNVLFYLKWLFFV